jgi:16S rRNA C967 or C1407 C5-methylase (RsmB/RsmF family)
MSNIICALLSSLFGLKICSKKKYIKMKFNKILVDAPCSGEGTLRKSPHTFQMWNLKFIENL